MKKVSMRILWRDIKAKARPVIIIRLHQNAKSTVDDSLSINSANLSNDDLCLARPENLMDSHSCVCWK